MSEDEVSSAETIRLMSGKTLHRNTVARWENVYRMYHEGKSLAEIGKWIGRSESTARQLLKRAHIHEITKGTPWPTKDGKKICDIPHPMPPGDNPLAWVHNRQFALTTPGRVYCPVCRRAFAVGRPLIEVLT